jgi:hypothetical protein
LDKIESDIQIINARLAKQDDFNKVVTNFIENQKTLNKKFSDYIESHP